MEPNEWQKRKNNKTTEYTQRITSQARIAEEKLLSGLNESEVYDYMLSKLNFCQRKQMYSSLEAKVLHIIRHTIQSCVQGNVI